MKTPITLAPITLEQAVSTYETEYGTKLTFLHDNPENEHLPAYETAQGVFPAQHFTKAKEYSYTRDRYGFVGHCVLVYDATNDRWVLGAN